MRKAQFVGISLHITVTGCSRFLTHAARVKFQMFFKDKSFLNKAILRRVCKTKVSVITAEAFFSHFELILSKEQLSNGPQALLLTRSVYKGQMKCKD